MCCCSALTRRRAIWKLQLLRQRPGQPLDDPVVLAGEQRLRGREREVLVGAGVAGDHRLRALPGQPALQLHRGRGGARCG
jgi:hypothetical protein